uniref:t-SNARE coiled-coil homology domain-containing protein n=1 Tax=Timema monikensis TaxID=170555 RepID=A0A7R9HNU0_9NEOP|nr:unnamed protein product [Timema monikensis]
MPEWTAGVRKESNLDLPAIDSLVYPESDDLDYAATEAGVMLFDLNPILRIVEKNPGKFKIDNKELSSRKSFIDQTREEVKVMKDKMNISRGRDRDRTARQVGTAWLTGTVEGMKYFRRYYDRIVMPLLENSPARVPTSHGTTKYSKLENELDSPNRQFLDDTLQQQNHMVRTQDEQLDMISDSVGTLKTVSRQIGSELDEQAVSLSQDLNLCLLVKNYRELSANYTLARTLTSVATQSLTRSHACQSDQTLKLKTENNTPHLVSQKT